jgi:hypothetical protein
LKTCFPSLVAASKSNRLHGRLNSFISLSPKPIALF